jgi:putative transposase
MPPKHPERRTLRLPTYDYSQPGAYFITICTQQRLPWFGDVVDGAMLLNDVGCMVETWWHELGNKFSRIELDACVFMPNHVHGIICIVTEGVRTHGCAPTGIHTPVTQNPVGADLCVRPDQSVRPPPDLRPSLGKILQWFKTMTTNRYLAGVKQSGWHPFPGRLWQRNYYEHVIRNEESLNRIREYITTNPCRWHLDRENSLAQGKDDFDDWLASFTKRP